MKTILIINAIVAIFVLIMMYLIGASAKAEFMKSYPTAKFEKTSVFENVGTILRIILMSICPILNILFLLAYIFKWEDVKEGVIDNLTARMIEE